MGCFRCHISFFSSMIISMDQLTFLATFYLSILGVISRKLTIVNNCNYTVWPALLPSSGSLQFSSTGFVLEMGGSRTFSTHADAMSFRIWGRTQCIEDSSGNFSCATGDCDSGKLECEGSGATPPTTLAEFTLGGFDGLDFYDVSLVDGYNVPMMVVPQGGCGGCSSTGCPTDLNSLCPSNLKVMSKNGKEVMACMSACEAFGSPKYCCSGPYGSPSNCKPSPYSQIFKTACPRAYSYAYDDATSTFTCVAADYTITFCPSQNTISDPPISSSSCEEIITSSHFIKDPKTIRSNGSLFTLGFFSPENSTNRYVGIWYMSNSTIVWVANRNQPLNDSSGTMTIYEDGNLVVLNGQKQIIWSTNVSDIASTTTTCRLLDTGNLVLIEIENKEQRVIWQSFDHPSDTLLPGMAITRNKKTGEKEKLTAWKSQSDPSLGNFYASLELLNFIELFIWNATSPYWRSGPSNGRGFTQVPMMNFEYSNGANQLSEQDETLRFTFHSQNGSHIKEMVVLNSKGKLLHKQWDDTKKQWQETYLIQNSDCDVYNKCGAFGICNPKSAPICSCMSGFEPSNNKEWNRQKWNDGCVRKSMLQCEREKEGSAKGKEDRFFHLQKVKTPNFGASSSDSEDKCKSQCLENCNCTAYSYDSVLGCMSWKGNLIDTQQLTIGGVDLYIRAAYSDLGKKRHLTFTIIIIAIIGTTSIGVTCAYFLWKSKAKHSARKWNCKWFVLLKRREANITKTSNNIMGKLSQVQFQELLVYDFGKVAIATNNFQLSNKLGQGGFGPVYKGTLEDGQDIAVKRLSKASGQGQDEFMNEIVVISKLQHRNLVKLLGCCTEGEEKMLIYEYMPNKSLDAFIFDPQKRKLLHWGKRFVIIEGVARGVLYLHRDSRLKIIHRDLKASNILLDENLIPKISDFGMARIFKGSEDQANTRKVVGTYGYMSPEYAMEGLFSEKSDVFSFGILLLEIISGRRNSSFYNNKHSLSLLGFAWKLWNEGNIVQLIDPEIFNQNPAKDILRCIQIGLLCVQDLAIERPSMSTVVSMLNSEIVHLPPPRQPAFTQWQSTLNQLTPEENQRIFSNNEVSISDMEGR